MANQVSDTGQGATITLSGSTLYDEVDFTSIQIGQTTIPVIDATKLSTTAFRESIPGDLSVPNDVTLVFNFDPDGTVNHAPPTLGTVETLTITFPLASTQSAASTYVGTGFFISHTWPNLETDALQTATSVFHFDGFTGPTYTAGA